MVNVEELSYNNFELYNGDFLTIWSKEKDSKDDYTLIDSFKIDSRYNDKIDIWNQLKEIYHYNKTESNEIYYNFLIKEDEL